MKTAQEKRGCRRSRPGLAPKVFAILERADARRKYILWLFRSLEEWLLEEQQGRVTVRHFCVPRSVPPNRSAISEGANGLGADGRSRDDGGSESRCTPLPFRPAPPGFESLDALEVELQAKLNLARGVRGAGDLTEVRTVQAGHGNRPYRGVESIKHLHAELEPLGLANRKFFEQGEVD